MLLWHIIDYKINLEILIHTPFGVINSVIFERKMTWSMSKYSDVVLIVVSSIGFKSRRGS